MQRPGQLTDPDFEGAAREPVLGAFVTLKRRGQLRSCCGSLGRPTTIFAALSEAALATATRDGRLPSVSPTELEYLDLEVSLLHSAEPITARGEERRSQVTVGKHGLQIARGGARGLLLPDVPVEHEWDVEQFLQRLCLKARLPATAWKEDDAQLTRFEGVVFQDPLDKAAIPPDAARPASLLSEAEVARLAEFYRNNVGAIVQGATPSYYLPNCTDGSVTGATIALRISGEQQPIRLGELSLRPGLPLQATLLELARMAANILSRGGFHISRFGELSLGLTVVYDPAMHGTVAEPDLRGLDPQRRALLVIDNTKSAWTFDPERSPEELLRETVERARVSMPETAAIYSMAASSTDTPVSLVNVPRPQQGPNERPAGVAGLFYPADADELSRMVDDLLGGDCPRPKRWPAVLVPHAGLRYSGRIAADVFRRIEIPETVIVLAPKHTRLGVEWAVAPHETWSLPGVSVPSDPELARQLADAIPELELDALGHQREHAIEVELPLLARLAPQSRVVGIVIGGGNLERCQAFAAGLADVLRERAERTLLVVSSDMNHYSSDTENRRLDEIAMAALERLDPAELLHTVQRYNISMCGVLPAVIVLETLARLKALRKCQRVAYATTADVSGEHDRVVGYAGMLFG